MNARRFSCIILGLALLVTSSAVAANGYPPIWNVVNSIVYGAYIAHITRGMK